MLKLLTHQDLDTKISKNEPLSDMEILFYLANSEQEERYLLNRFNFTMWRLEQKALKYGDEVLLNYILSTYEEKDIIRLLEQDEAEIRRNFARFQFLYLIHTFQRKE